MGAKATVRSGRVSVNHDEVGILPACNLHKPEPAHPLDTTHTRHRVLGAAVLAALLIRCKRYEENSMEGFFASFRWTDGFELKRYIATHSPEQVLADALNSSCHPDDLQRIADTTLHAFKATAHAVVLYRVALQRLVAGAK